MNEDKRARLDEIKETRTKEQGWSSAWMPAKNADWLITELEAAWAEVERLRAEHPDVVLTWGGGEKTGLIDANRVRAEAAEKDAAYQRRHRKWALKELHWIFENYLDTEKIADDALARAALEEGEE